MKVIFFCTFFTIIFSLAKAQEYTTYKVTNFVIDNENYDNIATGKDVIVTFYTCDENNTICFANYWLKDETYSYGPAMNIRKNEIPKKFFSPHKEELQFTWWFSNSYDSISGKAEVTFKKVIKRNKVKFSAEVFVRDTKSLIELEGYLESSNTTAESSKL